MEMLMKCSIYKSEVDIYRKSPFHLKTRTKQNKSKHKNWDKNETLTGPLLCKWNIRTYYTGQSQFNLTYFFFWIMSTCRLTCDKHPHLVIDYKKQKEKKTYHKLLYTVNVVFHHTLQDSYKLKVYFTPNADNCLCYLLPGCISLAVQTHLKNNEQLENWKKLTQRWLWLFTIKKKKRKHFWLCASVCACLQVYSVFHH